MSTDGQLDVTRAYHALIGGIDEIIRQMEHPETYPYVHYHVDVRRALKHARESAERYGREAE